MAEAAAPVPHPTLGGKSLESYPKMARPQYQSWRKKYRKLKHRFDGALDENKQLFKDDLKLQSIAKRLREELDGLLELCLDLNENPSIPPELRFDVKMDRHREKTNVVPENIAPEASNALLQEYTKLVNQGAVPHLDLHIIRDQIDDRLAAQGIRSLDDLDGSMLRPTEISGMDFKNELRLDINDYDGNAAGFLGTDEEDAFLLKQYAQLGDQWSLDRATDRNKNDAEEKEFAELTTRELDRHIEITNPQSVHNWLRAHSKSAAVPDDNDSLASQDGKAVRKRGKNLAKQVGEKAVEKAREAASPDSANTSDWERDDIEFVEGLGKGSKKRVRDPDSTYRAKGGKGNSTSSKAKRKRTSGDDPAGSSNGTKKTKLDTEIEA